jgi:hypothetical protein
MITPAVVGCKRRVDGNRTTADAPRPWLASATTICVPLEANHPRVDRQACMDREGWAAHVRRA